MRQGNYYLGRIVKIGALSHDMIIEAILNSPIIASRRYLWQITDTENHLSNSTPFIFGKLSKFELEGPVTVVDTLSKSQIEEITENLLIASSPFVYLPEFSGIAYLHVWNQIQEEVFPKRFSSIIMKAYDNFFVDCKIEAITDYGNFITRIGKLEKFIQLSANVHPPNPLFGRLWKSLEKYIRERNVTELSIKEDSDQGVKTDIQLHMQELLSDSNYSPKNAPSLTDAALLMAADGYGNGKVIGTINEKTIIVKTSDTKMSFQFSKEPDPNELAYQALLEFLEINKDRDMDHSQ